MFHLHICLVCIATLLLSIDSGQSAAQGKPKPLVKAPEGAITTGHHIVVLREDTSKSDLHNVIEKVKRMSEDVVVHRYTEHVGKTLTVNAPDHVMEKIRYLSEVNHIEEEDVVSGATNKTKNPTINGTTSNSDDYLWFLDRLNQPNLPLDNIFTDTFNTHEESVDVYVLDSGIEFDHSEFENRAKYAGYDPMDEYHIITVNIPDYIPQRGRDCNGHGTLVASLIGGKTFGTAKKVNLFSVRVLDCQLSGATSVILDGLNFIATQVSERKRPAIVSMALRGTIHSSLDTAISTLYNDNVLIVGSVGNTHSDACNYFPGSNAYVLRVGASTANDSIYEKSNYGMCVDVFAPGEHIRGADPSCPTCTTGDVSGTSLASALVCGIAAVHLSQLPFMNPNELKRKVIAISSKDVFNISSAPATPNRLANFDYGGTFFIPNSMEEVILTSPNFPKHYSNSSLCTWTIYSPEKTYVYVDFSYIKIEQTYDWLKVCSGKQCSKDSQLVKLSGDYGETSCGYYSSTNILTLELHTDETTTSTGFKAKCMVARKRPSGEVKECSDYKKDNVTALQLDAVSQGTNHGNRFSMSLNWEEVFGGRRRGFNIAIIDEVSGKILKTMNFDTYPSNTPSLNLANKIENLHPGALVIMSSSGNAVNYFDTRARRAIATLGSTYSYSIGSGSSWALVGMKGLARGRAIEFLDHNAAVHVSTQVKLQPNKWYGLRIAVMSRGNYNGAAASITIDENEVEIHNRDGNKIGLNVIVFEEDSGKVLETRVFNTHTEVVADYSPSSAFADFIEALPDGRVVAIAIRGDAITHLTEEAKLACEKIGSRFIRDVQIDRSWAIIGRKGAPPGEVAESMKYYSTSWASYYLPVNKNNSSVCKISAASSTNWGGCDYSGHKGTYISIANNTYPSNFCPNTYGIIVGLVSENSCEFESTSVYNIHADYYGYENNRLVSFINSIANGRIVVATIGYDGISYLFSNTRTTLESIGSAHIQNVGYAQAWVIIGRKGAAPGSVPEAYHAAYTAAISVTVPLTVPDLPSVSSCEDSLYPLNCRAGMSI